MTKEVCVYVCEGMICQVKLPMLALKASKCLRLQKPTSTIVVFFFFLTQTFVPDVVLCIMKRRLFEPNFSCNRRLITRSSLPVFCLFDSKKKKRETVLNYQDYILNHSLL